MIFVFLFLTYFYEWQGSRSIHKWPYFIPFKGKERKVSQSCPTLCDPMDCSPTRLLHPWDFPVKNIGMGCHCLLQIFLTQGLNPGLTCIVGRRFTIWATRESFLVLICLNYSDSDSRIFLCSFNRTVMTLPFRFLKLDAPTFILYISCLRTEITHFSKELWFI